MTIGILTQYYAPEIGAPQARLGELAAAFVRRGHKVVVLTAMPSYPTGRVSDGYGGAFRREHRDGCTVLRTWAYPTKSVSMVKRLASYFSFAASSVVGGALTAPRLDYLVVESPPLFLGLSGWLLARLKGARPIFNVSDLWPETAVRLGVLSNGWRLRAAQRLERFCYDSAWTVSGQSHEIVAAVEALSPGTPTFHLSNGVNTAMFDPSLRDDSVRRQFGFEGCVALYSGLHGIAQGLLQVLAAASLLKDVPGLSFAFIGDGPDKEMLVARAREMGLTNVVFHKAVPRDAMPKIVSSADIGLVPLKVQLPGAVPSKLYEFMGSGVPVVLAATDEPARIVHEAGCGLVAPPENPAELAAAIRDLALNPAMRRTMGQRGREAAERLYDRREISFRFVRHLERHLADGASAAQAAAAGSGGQL